MFVTLCLSVHTSVRTSEPISNNFNHVRTLGIDVGVDMLLMNNYLKRQCLHGYLRGCVCVYTVFVSFRYDLPQYGSRRKLISPAGTYDEYGEVIVEDDGSYYYSPHESEGEVENILGFF